MIIALYKPNKLQLFFAKLVSLLSIKSIEWEGNNNKKFDSIINFPNSKEYTKLMEESRVLLDIFYTERFNSSKHQISNIYFRKSYDLKFLDYYVFRKEVEKKSDLNKKIYCLGGGYRKYIYKKPKLKITKYYLLPWYIFFSYTTYIHFS